MDNHLNLINFIIYLLMLLSFMHANIYLLYLYLTYHFFKPYYVKY